MIVLTTALKIHTHQSINSMCGINGQSITHFPNLNYQSFGISDMRYFQMHFGTRKLLSEIAYSWYQIFGISDLKCFQMHFGTRKLLSVLQVVQCSVLVRLFRYAERAVIKVGKPPQTYKSALDEGFG